MRRTTLPDRIGPFAVLLAAAGLVAAGTAAARADVIEVRGAGPKINGTIESESPTRVTIRLAGGDAQEVPVNTIERISYSAQPIEGTQAAIDERAGRFQQAADQFAQAADQASEPRIAEAMQFGQLRNLARLALSGAIRSADLVGRIEDFLHKYPESRFRYEADQLLAELDLRGTDPGRAAPMIADLAKAAGPEYPVMAEVYRGRLLIAEHKLDQAITLLDRAIATPARGPGAQLQQAEAYLAKGRALKAKEQYDRAAAAIQRGIDLMPAEAAEVQAPAYILLGDTYREAGGRPTDALLAYLHVELLYPRARDEQPKALYYIGQLFTDLKRPDRAAEAFNRLRKEYPRSHWAAKLAVER